MPRSSVAVHLWSVLFVACAACAADSANIEPPPDREPVDTGTDAGFADGGFADSGLIDLPVRPRLWPVQSRIDVGTVRIGSSVRWAIDISVLDVTIDLAALEVDIVDADGWRIDLETLSGVIEADGQFQLSGVAAPSRLIDLDGELVLRHPAVPGVRRLSIRGATAVDPRRLSDPEDIGFGLVQTGTTAVVTAFFSQPARVLTLPPPIAAESVAPPSDSDWVQALRLRFSPTETTTVARGALEVAGRRIPIVGRGVPTPLRLSPVRDAQIEVARAECVDRSLHIGNPGLGVATVGSIELRTTGPIEATRIEPRLEGTLAPLTFRGFGLRLCATGVGPFQVIIAANGVEIGRRHGVVRGGELDVGGPRSPADLVAQLSRTLTATIANRGLASLVVRRVEVAAVAGGQVEILSPVAPRELVAEAATEIEVSVTPVGDGEVTLRIVWDDGGRVFTTDVALPWRTASTACEALDVRTTELDFGRFAVGRTAPVMALELENSGTRSCSAIVPAGLPRGFDWVGTVGEPWGPGRRRIEVAAGGRALLPVALSATTSGTYGGELVVDGARGGAPSTAGRVTLTGELAAEGLAIDVQQLPTCVDDQSSGVAYVVGLFASGARPITVVDHDIESDGLVSVAIPRWPVALGQASVSVSVENRPGYARAVTLELRYRVGDTEAVARHTVLADFTPLPEVSDRFRQIRSLKTDTLMVVDGSASMDDIDGLRPSMERLAEFAVAQQLEHRWFVAAMDRDDPTVLVMPPGEPAALDVRRLGDRAAAALIERVELAQARSRDPLEQPIAAVLRAVGVLQAERLLREEARLSILAITDEDDASLGSVEVAINALLAVKGFRNTNLFSFNAVAGPPFNGDCPEPRSADPAPRLRELIARTGGVMQSPCSDDWSRSLEEISFSFGFKSRFFLSQQPQQSSIRVFVDGVELAANNDNGTINWTYDFPTNSINFSPFASPPPGASVEVRYVSGCP